MSTWWERLKEAMAARDLSPEQVAERSGVPVKSVYGYLQGQVANPRGNVLHRLAAAAGTTEGHLRLGSIASNSVDTRKIPLLTMNEIGTLGAGQSVFEAWNGVAFVAVPFELPDCCFGVELSDESCAPEFSKGDVVILDARAELVPGKMAIAVAPGLRLAYFGRYKPLSVVEPNRFAIVPLNNDFPPLEFGTETPGFVVARAIKHIRSL